MDYIIYTNNNTYISIMMMKEYESDGETSSYTYPKRIGELQKGGFILH